MQQQDALLQAQVSERKEEHPKLNAKAASKATLGGAMGMETSRTLCEPH